MAIQIINSDLVFSPYAKYNFDANGNVTGLSDADGTDLALGGGLTSVAVQPSATTVSLGGITTDTHTKYSLSATESTHDSVLRLESSNATDSIYANSKVNSTNGIQLEYSRLNGAGSTSSYSHTIDTGTISISNANQNDTGATYAGLTSSISCASGANSNILYLGDAGGESYVSTGNQLIWQGVGVPTHKTCMLELSAGLATTTHNLTDTNATTTYEIRLTGVDVFSLVANAPTGSGTPSFISTNAPVSGLTITKWIAVTVNGVAGYIPFFSA